jgi:ABC-type dipeptide/oligopeptide/nickel transport system permease component
MSTKKIILITILLLLLVMIILSLIPGNYISEITDKFINDRLAEGYNEAQQKLNKR